jgi:hypothetical protein
MISASVSTLHGKIMHRPESIMLQVMETRVYTMTSSTRSVARARRRLGPRRI